MTPEKKNKANKPHPEPTVIIHQYPSVVEWVGKWSVKVAAGRTVFFVSLLLFLMAVISYLPTIADDYDIWFHLKYGEHYFKNLTWTIDHSQFSWTPSLSDWKYVTWVGDIILYLIYSLASGPGLYFVQAVILIGIGVLYFCYIRSIGDTLDIGNLSGFFLVIITLKLTIVYVKPEIFTTFFFALTLFIYFRAKSSSKNLFWLYPILFLIWVNTHGGFIFGLFFVSLAFAGEIINSLFIKKASLSTSQLKMFAFCLALSYLSVMVNPSGLNYHIELFKMLFSKEYMGEATQLFAYFSMWKYLSFSQNMFNFVNAAWSFIIMAVLFMAAGFYAFQKKRHFDLIIILLNVIFFFLGMSTARATLFFPLLWFFSILFTLYKADGLSIKKGFAPIALILLLFWSGNLLYTTRYLEHRSWFGVNLEEFIPVKEVEFLKKNKLPGPIFNDYLIGGYMIWKLYPDYKVFIDSRYGPYVKQVLPDWFNLKNTLTPDGLQKFQAKYPFKIALLHMREGGIILWLLQNDWRLAYFNDVAVVLIHKSVIPFLTPEAKATDLGTKRFIHLKNPGILNNLFYFYVNIHPNYGREMLTIFTKNVSEWYAYKSQRIKFMEDTIFQKVEELKNKQLEQKTKKTSTPG